MDSDPGSGGRVQPGLVPGIKLQKPGNLLCGRRSVLHKETFTPQLLWRLGGPLDSVRWGLATY